MAGESVVPSVDVFFNDLAPNGSWYDDSENGWVFAPPSPTYVPYQLSPCICDSMSTRVLAAVAASGSRMRSLKSDPGGPGYGGVLRVLWR